MALNFTKYDRQASRYVHKLFWRATAVDLSGFIIWVLTRPAALLIYNVLIPFQVAYGLQAIITRQFDRVEQYALIVLFLGIAYCVLWAAGGMAICRNGRIGTEFIYKEAFANYLNKDYDFYNNTFLGSLGAQVMRLKDAFNDYSVLVLNQMTKQAIIVVASITIIAWQSLLLAAITLAGMMLILSFTLLTSRWRLKYRRLVSEANSEAAGIIGDALGHGAAVKSFAAENYEEKHAGRAFKKQVEAQYWSWMSSIPADVGRMLLAVVATIILLLFTSRLYEQNAIPIAIVILIQMYVIKLVNATQEIAEIIKSYEALMGSAHQAAKTMLLEPAIVDKSTVKKLPRRQRYDLSFNNAAFCYDDAPQGIHAIKNLNLHIAPGEKVGVVGYSGSGKTTLTKLLLRFMDVTDGSITIGGIDIRDLAQKELRKHIAYVPQEPLLFHRSIAENIAYGRPSASQKAVRQAGKAAYVDEFVAGLSHGYDTQVGEKGVKLSGGQRQRVAIARALLKDAPILVLDEATSALDSKSEQLIQKALWQLMEGRTALVIAHRLSTIQHMDKIIVMEQGRIVEAGTHQELLRRKRGIYRKLWEHQSGGYLVSPNPTL